MLSMLISLFSGQMEKIDVIVYICVLLFIAFCCFPVHESAHAWMADKLGDPTGRLKGRITLNPFAHLDLMGTIMILVFGFGYAKPVPVNIRNFKKRKKYFAITALAGPVSNLIMALFFALCLNTVNFISNKMGFVTTVVQVTYMFFYYAVSVNVSLALFNLIPIPPLDGSRLLTAFLPDRIYYKIMQYERYSMYILFGIIFLFNRIGFSPLSFLSNYVSFAIRWLTALPFKLFM